MIEGACYSDLVVAENQNLPYTKILVDKSSRFKYKAFGFEGLSNQNMQALTCQVRFCIMYADGSLDGTCQSMVERPCAENYSRKEVTCDNYEEFLMNGESCRVELQSGKKFSSVKSLSNSFKLNFDFTPDFNSYGARRNILTLQSEGVSFLTLNLLSYYQLEICFIDKTGFKVCRNSLTELQKDELTKIEVENITPQDFGLTSTVFVLKVDGEIVQNILNPEPVTYSDVTIFMSGDADLPAYGTIQDFHLFDLERNTMLLDSVEPSESDSTKEGWPSKGRFIETFSNWGIEFDITVDIRIDKNLEHEMWGNIIHFGVGGANENMGDRIPSIFVAPKSQGKRIFVCSSLAYSNGAEVKSHCVGSGETFGEWTSVRVRQFFDNGQFTYQVSFNGAVAEEIADIAVQSYGRVHLWASNPWSVPAKAEYRNLAYEQPTGRFLNEQTCEGNAVEWTPWLDTKTFKRKRREFEEVEEGEENEEEIMTYLRRKNRHLCPYPSAIQAQETVRSINYSLNNYRNDA